MCFAVMANIFLLEDDKILSKGISIALEKDKHTVTVVYGYMEALQTYQNQRYDLLKNKGDFRNSDPFSKCERYRAGYAGRLRRWL